MNSTSVMIPEGVSAIAVLARCFSCAAPLQGEPDCHQCGRAHPIRDGILDAIGPLQGRNRIVAAFYDGPGWVKFKPWEERFLLLQGGAKRARMQILHHVVKLGPSPIRVLEVGIGDGANLAFLPPEWSIFGVDVSRVQLAGCMKRRPEMFGRLAWAEAEHLPFPDSKFDASYSVGGFTYYRDHESALREMRRVTKAGGPVVVADEIAGLHRGGLGHLLGLPAVDAWWLRKLGLDPEFVSMALTFNVDLNAVITRALPRASHHRIWHGLGYCLCDTSS
jgi:SAM-dependent methyltransferase